MKILNCILTLGFLGGMVSCYPVAADQSNSQHKNISANSLENKAKKTVTKKKISYHDIVTPDYEALPTTKVSRNNKEVADTSDILTTPKKKVIAKKPTTPAILKVQTAKRVPKKEGFVFNPYTYNQVDVRGIPSGTKVRDPHDSNPAHVFRVP